MVQIVFISLMYVCKLNYNSPTAILAANIASMVQISGVKKSWENTRKELMHPVIQ